MKIKKYKINEITDEMIQGSWTLFWDMHSGGSSKESFDKIFIQETIDIAKLIFFNIFGHNPNRVTCTCCGEDYAISEEKNLTQATAYHRGCEYDSKRDEYLEKKNEWIEELIPLLDYINEDNVLIIPKSEIKDEWRTGEIPEQGYVWVD